MRKQDEKVQIFRPLNTYGIYLLMIWVGAGLYHTLNQL